MSAPTGWTEYSYDSVGRVMGVKNPDSTGSIIKHHKRETTYNDANGNKKVQEVDAYGDKIKVYEFRGAGANDFYVTNCKYDFLGNLTGV